MDLNKRDFTDMHGDTTPEVIKRELAIVAGLAVGMISIMVVTGVAYYLSMYQILGA